MVERLAVAAWVELAFPLLLNVAERELVGLENPVHHLADELLVGPAVVEEVLEDFLLL